MGFIFALCTALLISIRSVLEKKALKNIDEFFLIFGFRIFAGVLIFLLIFFWNIDVAVDSSVFYIILFFGSLCCSISSVCAIKAIKKSDLSLVGPVMTLTPLFVLVTSPIMIGQFPSLNGLAGVLLIVFGSYVLNIKEVRNGFKEPIKVLLKNEGVRYMLVATFIWSIGSNIDKMGVDASNPFVWSALVNTLSGIMIFPILLGRKIEQQKRGVSCFWFLGIAVAVTLSSLFQLMAINLILVIYVISLKRLSAVFHVFIGHFVFKEDFFLERLSGAVVMIAGALLIIFS